MMTTGIDRRGRLRTRGNRLVELLDMSDCLECIPQVFEMQDGCAITNVYSIICGAGFDNRRHVERGEWADGEIGETWE